MNLYSAQSRMRERKIREALTLAEVRYKWLEPSRAQGLNKANKYKDSKPNPTVHSEVGTTSMPQRAVLKSYTTAYSDAMDNAVIAVDLAGIV